MRLSGAERARRRGAGMVLVRPPADLRPYERWHILAAPGGGAEVAMRWAPGIEVWFDLMGVRLNAEVAGATGWSYLRALPEQTDPIEGNTRHG